MKEWECSICHIAIKENWQEIIRITFPDEEVTDSTTTTLLFIVLPSFSYRKIVALIFKRFVS